MQIWNRPRAYGLNQQIRAIPSLLQEDGAVQLETLGRVASYLAAPSFRIGTGVLPAIARAAPCITATPMIQPIDMIGDTAARLKGKLSPVPALPLQSVRIRGARA